MYASADAKYYEVAKPASVAERILIQARDRIYRDFLARMRPSAESTIVDVGVSDVVSDAANMLERKYPHKGRITACGIGDGAAFRAAFPLVGFHRIQANVALPFPEANFDIAAANAVLEHVGSHDSQLQFIRELCRVARSVFISVPNRYFPIEHHTAIPLLHYADRTFRLGCAALGKDDWAKENNLILMTRKKLWRLVADIDRSVAVGYTGFVAGPLSSNLYLAIH
jgi:SAM-dependent methyltransferase